MGTTARGAGGRYTARPVSLVVFEGVSLAFGGQTIVSGLDLRVAAGDRLGLVGPNGSGKSTILRMMAGEQEPDAGRVRRRKGLRVGYLPQDLDLRGGVALGAFVRGSVPGRDELEAALADSEVALARAQDEGDEEAMMEAAGRLADLHEHLAHFETEFSEHQAARILSGLGFAARDLARDVAEFSGGWRMRAVLAALLFQRPDLLLLDEPTNHLDMPSVAWLSGFLRRGVSSFVLISHDREFLDEQTTRTVGLEPDGARQHPGNFSAYRKRRAEEEEVLRNKARNLEREREQAERFIERFRSQASKAKAVQSRIRQLARLDEVRLPEARAAMNLRFPPAARAGDPVLRVEGLGKSFGDVHVLDGVDLHVRRGDRIGLIGPNGAGKTTLLRLVAGELDPDRGRVRLGHNVTVGHYAQHHAEALDPSHTIVQELAAADPGAGATRLRAVAGAMLFRGDAVDKPISVLSGGERARVALARLLLRPGNLLLMDEPTNHLDLESSERLAEALATYDGTLLFVSHNRAFVRALADKIWDVGDGRVVEYPGSLDDYLARESDAGAGDGPAAARGSDGRTTSGRTPVRGTRAEQKARRREQARQRAERERRLGPLRKAVTGLEGRIEALEAAQSERSAALADPEVYADEARRGELLDAFAAAAEELERLTARWEAAQTELEAAEAALPEP